MTKVLLTEESEGCTQVLQALNIQLNINMDQEHEDFNDENKRRKIPLRKIPWLKLKIYPRNTNQGMVPLMWEGMTKLNLISHEFSMSISTSQEWLVLI